jgi:signal transduction histidine kinase
VHRQPRARRPRPAPVTRQPDPARAAESEPLISLLTRAAKLTDVLPHLHQRALDTTGAVCSLLFEVNFPHGGFQATSAVGVNQLPIDAWCPMVRDRHLVTACFAGRKPLVIADADRQMPELSRRVGRRSLVLLPLAHGRHRMGLLALGFADLAAPTVRGDVMEIADAFVTTLDLFRLRQKEQIQGDVRRLLDEFTAGVSATLDLSAGLDSFCDGLARLFGADRAAVWIHDRRARELVQQSSSDPQHLERGVSVSADDPLAPAAAAMRKTRAELSIAARGATMRTVTVPLRGWRRALGAIVIDGVRLEPGGEIDLLERADELGRQLSLAIESMQLLETVIGPDARGLASVDIEAAAPHDDEIRRATASNRLPALGVFVAGIALELNNPLQGVLGHLELLRATGAFPKHLRREVQTIYREADRAAKIVRNLLMFAGSRRMTRRRVNLNVVLQRVVALRQPACRALEIEIVRHYDERLPRVLSDPLLLHQVFLNMVMNAEQAIAASGRPGRIEITTSTTAPGTGVVATVRDTGEGIPPEELIRIFEPFYTTKEVGKGTGLGLAIAYGIIHEHGGEISAANAAGGGAIFTVRLPAVPARGVL